jgi:VanZ family protein
MGSSASDRRKLILNWLPAACAVAMIAGESTSTMSAANTSRWLYPFWVHFFGPLSAERWHDIHHLIRKTGHFIGYGCVSLCFFYSWSRTLASAWRNPLAIRLRSGVLATLCTLIVASADEFHQSFLPSRTSSPYDVGIDVSGAILMQVLLLIGLTLFARNRQMKAVAV